MHLKYFSSLCNVIEICFKSNLKELAPKKRSNNPFDLLADSSTLFSTLFLYDVFFINKLQRIVLDKIMINWLTFQVIARDTVSYKCQPDAP